MQLSQIKLSLFEIKINRGCEAIYEKKCVNAEDYIE